MADNVEWGLVAAASEAGFSILTLLQLNQSVHLTTTGHRLTTCWPSWQHWYGTAGRLTTVDQALTIVLSHTIIAVFIQRTFEL